MLKVYLSCGSYKIYVSASLFVFYFLFNSSEQINVLQCNYCRRRIGLWNYKHAKETNGTERSHSGTENEQNDEENGEPSRKRIKIVRNFQLLL